MTPALANHRTLLRIVALLAVLFGVYGLQQLGPWWHPLAIRPGHLETLALGWGSFLLHGSLGHLCNNAFALTMILVVWPRLFSGWVLLWAGLIIQAVSMIALYFMPGQDIYVIGASHLIYGFWVMVGARLVVGFMRQGRTQAAWVTAAVMLGFYGLLFGEVYQEATALVRTQTSWEGHLAGILAGVLCAWLWRNADFPAAPARPEPKDLVSE